jgi:ribosomal protein S18 acetylase RimI-like enzyme
MNSKDRLIINVEAGTEQVILRAATDHDLSNLRCWKNAQREFFFHRDEITAEQQQAWFSAYQTRLEDYMFIVTVNEQPVGCMGIRYSKDGWDVYNVILGETTYGKRGFLGKAFQAMLLFALQQRPCPITLKVLKHNPAVTWYQKQGFDITSHHQDHFRMAFKIDNKQEGSL